MIMKTLLGVLSLAALLAVIEGGLRLWGIDPSTERMVAYQFDPTLGWKTREDFKYYRSSLYYGQFNYYNPEGLPTSADKWHDRASTTLPSIAILGSSFAESYYLPYEESFPALIERAAGKPVLNFGVSGYAPGQYLLRAREEFPKYTLTDIVVIFFPYKDLPGLDENEYQGYEKPYFGETLDKPVNTPVTLRSPEKKKEGFVGYVRNSALYTLLRPYVRKEIALGLREGNKTAIRYDGTTMERALRVFKVIEQENPNARLVIYQIPYYKELEDKELFQANVALYREACAKAELTCLSMDEIIATHPRADELFILGDGHVTAYGAKLIADDILRAISVQTE